ncbi:MAG TPA: ABC transporter permease [Polyangiaceae bacterium]|nr:ABC transporter permease [Polyangiaceae bacterium]
MDPRALSRFKKNKGAMLGAGIVSFLVLFAIFAPLVVGQDPFESDFAHGRLPVGLPAPPSLRHPLGTDVLYRDQLARLAHGARLSLEIGFAASAISLSVGAAAGIVAGFSRGRSWTLGPLHFGPDDLIMRFVDIGLSFPFLLLVMAIGAALDRTTEVTILLVLGLTSWLGTARIVRAKTIQIRDLDFVVASRALGQRTWVILLRHVLPNVGGILIILGTISIAQMILAESVLSYLSLGLPPPAPTWGRMLFDGQEVYTAAPWLLIAPGAAILLAVLGFNLLGEGLRDALDPKDS